VSYDAAAGMNITAAVSFGKTVLLMKSLENKNETAITITAIAVNTYCSSFM
jgi:predicted Kef-type K+ transport protein